MPSNRLAPGYRWFKTAVFALLAWNTAVFVLSGTFSEALDSAAWLILLALFELETGFDEHFGAGPLAAGIRAARLAAAAAICSAAIGYVLEEEWLVAFATIEFNVLRWGQGDSGRAPA